MDVLTLARAKEIATEVVEEFGENYVYPKEHKVKFPDSSEPTCVYVHEGKPSCMVGQILHRHGVSLEELASYENRGAYSVAWLTTTCGEYAPSFLSAIQRRQDRGQSWGVALEQALSIYPV